MTTLTPTRLQPLETSTGESGNLPPALSEPLGSGIKHWYPDELESVFCVASTIEAHKRITGQLPTHLECSPGFLEEYCVSIGPDFPPIYYVCGTPIHLVPVRLQCDRLVLSYGDKREQEDWLL